MCCDKPTIKLKLFIFQRLTRSPGYIQDIEQSSTGPRKIGNFNEVNRKRCVTESATGQMKSEDVVWAEVEGLFHHMYLG